MSNICVNKKILITMLCAMFFCAFSAAASEKTVPARVETNMPVVSNGDSFNEKQKSDITSKNLIEDSKSTINNTANKKFHRGGSASKGREEVSFVYLENFQGIYEVKATLGDSGINVTMASGEIIVYKEIGDMEPQSPLLFMDVVTQIGYEGSGYGSGSSTKVSETLEGAVKESTILPQTLTAENIRVFIEKMNNPNVLEEIVRNKDTLEREYLHAVELSEQVKSEYTEFYDKYFKKSSKEESNESDDENFQNIFDEVGNYVLGINNEDTSMTKEQKKEILENYKKIENSKKTAEKYLTNLRKTSGAMDNIAKILNRSEAQVYFRSDNKKIQVLIHLKNNKNNLPRVATKTAQKKS